MKAVIVLVFIFLPLSGAMAKHPHPEKYYQEIKCAELGGVTEYVLPDKTRIDCLTPEYAIEFDFANKWAESIGQALYYALQTNRQPGVVLILENPDTDMRYVARITHVATRYNLTIWLMI